jgi:hypothetical protein
MQLAGVVLTPTFTGEFDWMLSDFTMLHPTASVMVHEYEPTGTPDSWAVVAPLFHK